MQFRSYKNTDLTVSEVGFGLWTISTGWWGNFTDGEAIGLMHKAFDLGITLFDAADTGNYQCLLACNRPFCERGRALSSSIARSPPLSGVRVAYLELGGGELSACRLR
jgi:diketogulonate reductase-like aldo/keto reductase